MHVLIVDDEIPVATLLADGVEGQGHEVTVAHGGAEALALWRQQRPDAVFLDLRMPRMSGLDVLRAIRHVDADLAVVVITGHASPEEREAARRLGVTDFVEKPFYLNRVSDALAGLAHPRGGVAARARRRAAERRLERSPMARGTSPARV
jgi:CheY-like chemotaxis protein